MASSLLWPGLEQAGYSGDGGPATSAQLYAPTGVAVDAPGNLYIADVLTNRIRKVSSGGVITTVAGNGSSGFSGDGGPATSAQFYDPYHVTVDGSGNLYVSDELNNRIRLVRMGTAAALSIVTTSPLPQGTVGVAYSQTLNATGGVPPYTWAFTSSGLPGGGLTFASSGAISGTPATVGTYSVKVQVWDSASATATKDFSLTINSQTVNAATIFAGGIVNAASNATGQPIAAGSLVSIYGSNLAAGTAQAGSIPLPTSLNNVSVTFNNIPAPLFFVAPGQINAQVPWNVLPGGSQSGEVAVVVTSQGVASAPATVSVGPLSPGIFAVNFGVGNAIAINPDGSLAAPSGSIPGIAAHPAKAGDPNGLTILATGLGAMDSYPANGNNSPDKLRKTLTTPEVLVGGIGVPVVFSGASPQFVAVNQINITIPDGAPTGDTVPLELRSGGITTTNRVTIAVSGCCDPITMTPPDSLKVTGQAGQLNPSSYTITYTLQNNLASAIPYTLVSSAAWVTVSRTTGTLAPNGKDSFTVSLNSNANSLAAGSYAATVTLTDKLFGTTITRTLDLDLSAGACVNIAGQWVGSEKGTLRCTLTVNGESDTETDPISGGDFITISQQGCQVSYTSSSITAAFGSGQSLRQGQVEGTNVTFSGIMGLLATGFTYQKNLVEESGTIQNNVINLNGTGTLIASGVWQGMNTTFSCTATTTATMTKWQ